jgi:hypothetical protein
MNNTIKSYAFAVGILAMAALGVSALLSAFSYGKSVYPARTFSVQAQGKVTVIPDIASLNFTVLTEGGTNLGLLQQENTQKANAAIAFAKGQGIDEKDIKTSAYNIQPRYQYSRCFERDSVCPPPEIVGYSINQMVELKIRDFEKIGTILAGLVGKGANTVSGISFGVDEPEMVQNEARTQAIKKAKEKARTLAAAGGFRLGSLLSIEEGGVSPIPFYTLEAQSKGEIPTIEPGSQDITVSVSLRYEIR